ncbi:lysine-rich nucleolar protein 1 isoform X2 [Passer montanus]|uniref:lysine-rich nucleolar protein 1 isoform X2 n=1 Tax=Passer montanus TaxID=9160 RepID=UPI0019600AD2|nr:lysine-rich nucleolar protein 1 isoform X2 [Passer montanus]
MMIKKKRKDIQEEPVQKKKKVKTVIKIEEDVKTVIKTKDNGQLKEKTKTRKKENLKDECLHKFHSKNTKKNKKPKVGSELFREDNLESFVNIKDHLDLQVQEEPEEQIKIFKKKKKKVQCHFSLENNESSDVELPNHCTDGTKKNEFSSKKKRKHTALDLELDGEVTKKKKKKSKFSLEDIQDTEQRQYAKVCKNTHKYTSQKAVFMREDCNTGNAQDGGESCVRKKKNKKKDKSDCFLPLAHNESNMHRIPGSPTALNDFRKRKKHNSWEFTWTSREEEDKIKNFGHIEERKKKKKKKAIYSSTCEDKPNCSHSIPDKHLPAQQEVELEEEELSGKKHRKNFKDNKEVSKKKKKKIKKKEEEATYSGVSLDKYSASKSQKVLLGSSKKNKESKMERAQCVTGDTVDGTLCSSNPVLCDRKREKGPPQDLAEEPGSKAAAKTIKTESEWNESVEHLDGVIIVKEKKGNCDEINIDKDTQELGQWSTATFKSSAEQMKFFRLLGGFKKGSVPMQNPSATTNKPNMALNQEGEEKLQQALKMQFDKAMDLKQHRGIGLGFQPNANKKIYIDKYSSRSIKFED